MTHETQLYLAGNSTSQSRSRTTSNDRSAKEPNVKVRSFEENASVGDFEFVKQSASPEKAENNASSQNQSTFLKSLMKSYYNAGNHQFYDNLHKRYFDRAKAKAEHDGLASMFGDKRKGANRSPSEDNSNENCSLTLSRSRSKGI